jgi:hypothetical protein
VEALSVVGEIVLLRDMRWVEGPDPVPVMPARGTDMNRFIGSFRLSLLVVCDCNTVVPRLSTMSGIDSSSFSGLS